MDFSIIIVSWNVKEKLRENIIALLSDGSSLTKEIIIIDNASTDGSTEMIRQEFPQVQLIANQENNGFAKASNQGLKVATGDFLILLNPDMKILPDALDNLHQWLIASPQADVTGIKLMDAQEILLPQVRLFPSIWDQVAIVFKLPHIFPHILKNYLQADFKYDQASSVNSIRGAFFVLRRSCLEKFGFLDERYFLWFEEVDYCKTVHEKGGQVWYTPVATATDYIGQSFTQLPRVEKQQYFRDSMIAYFKKWHPGWQVETLRLAWEISELIVSIGDFFHIKPRVRT